MGSSKNIPSSSTKAKELLQKGVLEKRSHNTELNPTKYLCSHLNSTLINQQHIIWQIMSEVIKPNQDVLSWLTLQLKKNLQTGVLVPVKGWEHLCS